MNDRRKLNCGCGPYPEPKSEGWVNLDANPAHNPDVVRDVRRGLPFDDSSFQEVRTSHFLEHLDNDTLLFLIGEIYRVLCDGGHWAIVAPLGNTGDLDHKMLFTEDSFNILVRPEAASYFQTRMQWEEVPGGRSIRQELRGISSLHLRLRAVKS